MSKPKDIRELADLALIRLGKLPTPKVEAAPKRDLTTPEGRRAAFRVVAGIDADPGSDIGAYDRLKQACKRIKP